MDILKRLFVSLIFVFVSNCLLASTAHGKDQAAIVIIAAGDFYAINEAKLKRSLKRRSEIFVGDTLVTGNNGQGQVRFIDGAVVSLRPDTQLRINDYRYGDGKGRENSVMTLIKGGFRTITGAIGKEHYKVHSSLATIGIRGTHYEAVIAEQEMYVALWQGGVTVQNEAGQIDLGLGAPYNFAKVSAIDKVPKGLVSPPTMIMNNKQPAIAPSLAKDKKTSSDGKDKGQTQLASFNPSTNKTTQPSSLTLASANDMPTLPNDRNGVPIEPDITSTSDWLAEPTANMPTTGSANYNVSSFSGSSSVGAISGFTMNANVDFAAATINGNMTFTAGGGFWSVAYNGAPNGSAFDVQVNSGASLIDGSQYIDGDISGIFTGANADAVSGGFDLHQVSDPSINAQGQFVLEK